MKKPAAVKVIHSSKVKETNLKKWNAQMEAARESQRQQAIMYKFTVSEADLEQSYPLRTPADLKEGYYVFIKSAMYGPYKEEKDAQSHGEEIAYEMTFG